MAAEVIFDDRDQMGPDARRSAEVLMSQVNRFAGLLDEMLEISRYDAGVAELVTERVPVAECVVAAVAAVAEVVEVTGIPTSGIAVTGDPALIVVADRARLGRIVRNLLLNAIEHGGAEPVRVRWWASTCDEPPPVGVGPGERPGPMAGVVIEVADRGPGLPSDPNRMFERFWRAETSRHRTLGGTGLGLAMAANDAVLHGGFMRARDTATGATFALWLPVEQPSTAD